MKKLLYFSGFLLLVFALFVTFFAPSTTLNSPLGSLTPSQTNEKTGKLDYVILGFAPYWNLKKLSPESLTGITHFAYFHLLLNSDGSIYTHVNRKSEDPGYTNYKRLLSGTVDHGSKPLLLTFMPESQAALTNIVSSPTTRAATITTITQALADSHGSGVNIDFEPVGDTPKSVRDNFTLFIQELHTQLSTMSHELLTISIYPSAVSKPRIWDLAALTSSTDYFVTMTYDYTMPGDKNAGPNSPLRGSPNLYENDIIKNIAELETLIPSRKILLGIPFYGYEWDTLDSTKYSPTETKGAVASLERIEQMLDNQTLSLLWDRDSLTPYGIASSSGQVSQIYFENATSIRLKLEFVKSAHLGGIAIWALGYEGSHSWIWPSLSSLNQ